MPTAIRATDIRTPTPSQPGVPELVDELTDLGSGIGLLTIALFGAVPGFLPVVALTLVAGAIVLIPMLAVGLVIAAIAVPLLLIKWIVVRVAAHYRGATPAPPRSESHVEEHAPTAQLIGPARERRVALPHRSARALR
jgi:hypothetical protein